MTRRSSSELGARVGSRLVGGGGGRPVIPSAAAAAFLARTSGLDATHINAYIAFIDGLVNAGLISKFDALYIFATQDATTAALNLLSATYNATVNGSPTFTADRGFTGVDSSTTKYINTNFNPSTASSPKYIRNAAHISTWNVGNVSAPGVCMGCESSTGPVSTLIGPKLGDGNAYFRVNMGSVIGSGRVSNSDASGHYIVSRRTSTDTALWRNGSLLSDDNADASAGLNNGNIYVLATNSNGTASGASQQLAMASIGTVLNSTEAPAFYNLLRTYMTAVGVP